MQQQQEFLPVKGLQYLVTAKGHSVQGGAIVSKTK
jgi:hypothetical protein